MSLAYIDEHGYIVYVNNVLNQLNNHPHHSLQNHRSKEMLHMIYSTPYVIYCMCVLAIAVICRINEVNIDVCP